ncbi:hypothetical protein ACQP1O_16060 [Nocardia sp. CA-151230]|uniref:hypothetical protein n=1 Tax=Nocardia sp. CA-151230 TaxID=3239982 RepID=UPI003D8B61CE
MLTGDRLVSDVELSSVRRIAGKDLLTVTNTFTDQTGEVAQVMHTTLAGITGDDVGGISDMIVPVGRDYCTRTVRCWDRKGAM